MKRQLAILAVTAGLLPVVCVGSPAEAAEVRGVASVKSGNELVIGDRTLLLFGAAAPEVKETCAVDGGKLRCGIVARAGLTKQLGRRRGWGRGGRTGVSLGG